MNWRCALPNPPLHGFDVYPLPAPQLFMMSRELDRIAKQLKRDGLPLLAEKAFDRAAAIRTSAIRASLRGKS